MAELAGPFHLLQAGPGRYLCYCRPGPGPGGTHGTKLRWVLGLPGAGPRPRAPPSPSPRPRREALGRGAAALSLGEGKATLQVREEAPCSALELFKLPIAEARSQVQALVFGMAGRVESLERRLEAVGTLASSYSPEKNAARSQQLFLPDPSPRKNRRAGSALLAKRKIPGESLINPGFKSKKAPSGVDFEDS
ncbi:PAXX protein, partial [Glareola pratincola]|nr:PAXX protein [Glareola pratincola]